LGREQEGTIIAQVMRSGDLSHRSVVHYQTCDDTVFAGESYIENCGALVFEQGEFVKKIELELIDDDIFKMSGTFHVELLEDGLENCELDRHMRFTQLRIHDDDIFPSNTFREIIKAGKLAEVNRYRLLASYIKFCFLSDDVVRRDSIKTVVLHQMENLLMGFMLVLSVYLVDRVLNKEVPESKLFISANRQHNIAICSSLFIVVAVLAHMIHRWVISLNIAVNAKQILATSLLQRFLYCKDEVRLGVCPGQFMMILFNDTSSLIDNGYMRVLYLIKLAGEFFFYIGFLMFAPSLLGKKERPGSPTLVSCLVLPVMLIISLVVTHGHTLKCLGARHDAYEKCFRLGMQVVENDMPIKAYNRHAHYRERFLTLWQGFANSVQVANHVLENQKSVAVLLSALLVACLVFMGGTRVNDGTMEVGMLMASIGVITRMGTLFAKAQNHMVLMQQSIGSLMRITKNLNVPIEMGTKRRMLQHCEETTMSLYAERVKEKTNTKTCYDTFPIKFEDIVLRIEAPEAKKLLRLTGSLEVQQGTLVALIGSPQVKSSILRMLNLEIPKESGMPYVPSHLRCLSVAREPMFIDGTLYENLIMGMELDDPDADMGRVLGICKRLGFSEEIMALIGGPEANTPEKNNRQWVRTLTAAERHIFQLARAFISNPHLLCLYSAGTRLGKLAMKKEDEMLREFVDNRGVDTRSTPLLSNRRPRTIIMTAYSKVDIELADQIIHIGGESCIKPVDRADVTPEMFTS
jgi:ABC-type uncharacterized transport system fused permease/ATPase subunit